MKLILFLQIGVGAVLALIVITQLIVPALRGTKLFPILRREGRLYQRMEAARQRKRDRKIQRDTEDIERKIK